MDLEEGEIDWEVPMGMIPELAEIPEAAEWGSLSFGGPIITAGGHGNLGTTIRDSVVAFALVE